MTAKEDVLLPQDAQAVDPSKLSALTPEVVSFARRRRGAAKHATGGTQWVMGSVVWRVDYAGMREHGGRYQRYDGHRET